MNSTLFFFIVSSLCRSVSAWHTFRLGKVFRTFLAPCQLWNSSHKKSRRNEIRQILIGILATRSTLWFLKFSLSSTRQIQLYNNENVVKVFPLWSVYSHINLSSNVMRITKGQSNSHLTVWGCSHREKLYLDIQRIRFFSLSQPLAKDSIRTVWYCGRRHKTNLKIEMITNVWPGNKKE